MALAGFVAGLVAFIHSPSGSTEAITSLIMSFGAVVAYIVGEGLADAAGAKADMVYWEEDKPPEEDEWLTGDGEYGKMPLSNNGRAMTMNETRKNFSTEQEAVTIPFFVHENEMVRLERLNKRWFIAFLIAIIILFVTNAGWIVYESQYQDEVYTYELQQDSGEGGENTYTNNRIIVGGDYNGEANGENNSEAPGTENHTDAENMP